MNANINPTKGHIARSINLMLLFADDKMRKFIAVVKTATPVASLVNVAEGGILLSFGSNFRTFNKRR